MQIDTLAHAYRSGQRAFRAGLSMQVAAGPYISPAAQAACANGYSDAQVQAGVPQEPDPCGDPLACGQAECKQFRVCRKAPLACH